ncbi:MAG TPA: hypothetical protein VEC99_01720 [Clostridia bacterium]|nr:hypothetical protein [Clostridia bacterium]
MKRHLVIALASIALAAPLASFAQSTNASAKVTVQTSYLNAIPPTSTPTEWQTVLEQNLKMANNHDLLVTAGFEVGLYTDTTVNSKLMASDTSTATASVKVRVLVDGKLAAPGEVVFGKRTQTLTATLEGAIASCLSIITNSAGGLQIVLNPECVQPEVIGLMQDTVSANSFSFTMPNLASGYHNIKVQAKIDFKGSAQNGSFSAAAVLGKGTMTAESVRLAINPPFPYVIQSQ